MDEQKTKKLKEIIRKIEERQNRETDKDKGISETEKSLTALMAMMGDKI